MSQTSKKLIDLHITEWESAGTETALGQRDFSAGQEPTAEEFDYHFYYVYEDVSNLLDAIETWVMPQIFRPESIELIGDTPGEFELLTGDDGRYIPAIKLETGVSRDCRVRGIVRKSDSVGAPTATIIRIRWSTEGTLEETAVWKIHYLAAGDDESLIAAVSTVTKQASDSTVEHGRVTTEVTLPVLTQGESLEVIVEHDGTAIADSISNDIYVHAIEVV
jgi:hypothetical protein